MESMLFLGVTYLLLSHKLIAAVSPLHAFRKILFKPCKQIFFDSIDFRRFLKDLKSRGITNLLQRVLIIVFSLVPSFIAMPTTFLHQPEFFNHLLVVYLGRTSLLILFHSSKVPGNPI